MVSCLWLCNPMHDSPPAPLSMEFSMQEHWSRLPFPPLGIFPNQGSNLRPLCCLHWHVDSLPVAPTGKLSWWGIESNFCKGPVVEEKPSRFLNLPFSILPKGLCTNCLLFLDHCAPPHCSCLDPVLYLISLISGLCEFSTLYLLSDYIPPCYNIYYSHHFILLPLFR